MNTRKILVAAVIALSMIVVPLLHAEEKGVVTAKDSKEGSPSIVAKVNGAIITSKDLEQIKEMIMARNHMEPNTPEEKKKLETAALDQLIYGELMYEQGVKDTPTDIDQLVSKAVERNRSAFPTPEEYQAAMKKAGLTEDDLKTIARRDIIINHFIEKNIVPTISAVSDKEIEDFYNNNKSSFHAEQRIRASHILVRTEQEAKDILAQLKNGASFEDLAKKYSIDGSAQQGGDLGFFGKNQMVPAFEKAAFALKKGEISDVVETQFGYHIIKVTDIQEPGVIPLKDVKDKIGNFLKTEKIRKAVFEYVTNLRKNAKVEIFI
ncbi:MAG: peptidylprolyl isomerase [Desulfuromonadales bacterium]|nr:peptidylprolyl isomerase [Desulfuromonadales bacterium]